MDYPVDKEIVIKEEIDIKQELDDCSNDKQHLDPTIRNLKARLSFLLNTTVKQEKDFTYDDCDDKKGEIFGCNLCLYRSRRRKSLIDHYKAMHLKDKVHACSKCTFMTVIAKNLIKHNSEVHSIKTVARRRKREKLQCNACPYNSFHRGHMETHYKSIHLKLKDRKCPHCAYQTSHIGSLRYHIRSLHTTIRPYKCPICSKCFCRSSSLESHLAVHSHSKCKCKICRKKGILFTAANWEELKDHQRSSHPELVWLSCFHCGHTTISRDSLIAHMNALHNKIKYPCKQCNYEAPQKFSLVRHLQLVHGKDKTMYPCDECDYAATQKSHLVSHVRRKHWLKVNMERYTPI